MERIESIRKVGENQPYFDFTVPIAKHYLAEGIWHHNTAKTCSILALLVEIARQYPGSRIALIRKYRADLTKSLLPTLEEEVFPMFGMTTPPGGFLDRKSRAEYNLGGSKIVPFGLDSDGAGSLLSTAWTMAYPAEATEIPFSLLTKLDGAMRWTKSARQPTLPERSQVIVDCNPVDPQHPLNLRAEDCPDSLRKVNTRAEYERLQQYNMRRAADPVRRWKRIVTKIQDNPGYWDMGAWDYTPQGRIYVKERLGGYVGHVKARWVDGLWKSSSGTVFPEYDPDLHDIEDFEPPRDWPVIVCWDPGFGTTAIVWMCVTPDGGVIAFDEIYEGGKSVAQHSEEIKNRNMKHGRNVLRYYGDPNEFLSNKSTGVSCARQARAAGLRVAEWPKQQGAGFDAGVDMVRQALINTTKEPRVAPYFLVCKRCTGLRSNFSSWGFKKKHGEVLEGADRYEAGNDHGIDCVRGGMGTGFLQRAYERMGMEEVA